MWAKKLEILKQKKLRDRASIKKWTGEKIIDEHEGNSLSIIGNFSGFLDYKLQFEPFSVASTCYKKGNLVPHLAKGETWFEYLIFLLEDRNKKKKILKKDLKRGKHSKSH